MAAEKEHHHFSERQFFADSLHSTINQLAYWERRRFTSEASRHNDFLRLRRYMETKVSGLDTAEESLYHQLFDLFEIKHGIGKGNKILSDQLKQNHSGKFIGFMGPLGVGKSTVAHTLIKDLGATATTKEPFENNPFWKLSQENPDYMLRSQVFFFLSNIFADIETRLHQGTSVSDTHTLTDVLMWANWYHQTGFLTDEEFEIYQEMVDVFQPVIPKPDLLVILKPTSINELKEGVRQRNRPSEQAFTLPEDQALAIQAQRVDELATIIPDAWNIPVLEITVPPLEIYTDPSLPYGYIYQIRERLGLLKELLNPQPEEVANQVIQILAQPNIPGQAIVIHAKSMFSGKTTAGCLIAEKLGKEKVTTFQPRNAIRSSESGFEEQDTKVISRDGLKIPATTIEDNDLFTLIKYIQENNINPKSRPYIFIDEIMLFSAQTDKPEKAVEALEILRKMGFHVIVDGIDYTFQEEPFTFMHQLLTMTTMDENWHQIEMSTRCRYCNERAEGTRRLVVNADGTKTIADHGDTKIVPGNSQYEPVCCKNHASCINHPSGFQKKELPI